MDLRQRLEKISVLLLSFLWLAFGAARFADLPTQETGGNSIAIVGKGERLNRNIATPAKSMVSKFIKLLDVWE